MQKEIVELAKLFKERNNKHYDSFLIGTVISPPPEPKIRISPEIILTKEHLIFSASVVDDYEREYEIYDAEIQFTDSDCGQTTVSGAHSHGIATLNVDSDTIKSKGKIKWIDTLKEGEKVILVPASNEQTYIVIERTVEYK